MENHESIIEIMGEALGDLTTSDLVVGSPLELGEVTIVPLSRVSIGFGGGGGGGSDESNPKQTSNTGQGEGGGGGGQVRPIAVAVFTGERVDVLKVPEKPSPIEKLLGQIPDLVERFKS